MRKIEDFIFSHSALKNYRERDICKLNWKLKYATKEIPRDESTDQMIKGIYFETLALGAHSGGEQPPEVPFLYDAKGKPRVELDRMHQQVDRFKEFFDPSHPDFLGFTITGVQRQIEDKDLKIKGIVDFEAVDEFDNDWIFDLKFTGDANNDRGDYAWGRNPGDIDWSQQTLYRELYKRESGKDPKMAVMVFDASPRKNIKLFKLKIGDEATDEVLLSYEDAWYAINKYEEEGWPVNPSEKNCSECPIECEFRYKSPTVETIKVYV